MIKEIIMHLWQQISIIYISLYVCMRFSCLHVNVCTMSVIGANGIHNRKQDLLELEVQMVMNHHVVLRLRRKSFARAEYLYIHACVCILMHTEIYTTCRVYLCYLCLYNFRADQFVQDNQLLAHPQKRLLLHFLAVTLPIVPCQGM